MSLAKVLRPPIPTYLLPELEKAILAEVRSRLRDQIEPELWKAQIDSENTDGFSNDFISQSIDLVEQVLNDFTKNKELAALSPGQFEFLRDVLWEKSQAYWYELAPEFEALLTLLDRISQSARLEIENLFPQAEKVLGPMANSLLVDVAFQYELYRFSKQARPDLIDLRRIINVSGQIIEAIFTVHFFIGEDLRLGKILDRLSKSRKAPNESLAGFRMGDLLRSSFFLNALNHLNTLRNRYSHGTSGQTNIEEDFRSCIATLIAEEVGLLRVTYQVLKERV